MNLDFLGGITQTVVPWALGVAAAFIGGNEVLKVIQKLVGSDRVGVFASRALVTALRRGILITKEEIQADGWQPDDLVKGLQESARVILGAATSETAVDMYLYELPEWLMQAQFGSKDAKTILAEPQNVELIETQLNEAADKLITGDQKQIIWADTWFRAATKNGNLPAPTQ
ncbi:MAG: hypothetical protein AAF267_19185 [Deinococcota bacterium]